MGVVPKTLEEARLMNNLNQSELARKAGVNRKTVWRLENGFTKKAPHTKTIGKIALALDINPLKCKELIENQIETNKECDTDE